MDKETNIHKIRVYYDKKGNTLNVWFDDPENEYISEETGEEVIIVKDKHGKVIGFEKLNYFPAHVPHIKTLPVEVVVA